MPVVVPSRQDLRGEGDGTSAGSKLFSLRVLCAWMALFNEAALSPWLPNLVILHNIHYAKLSAVIILALAACAALRNKGKNDARILE